MARGTLLGRCLIFSLLLTREHVPACSARPICSIAATTYSTSIREKVAATLATSIRSPLQQLLKVWGRCSCEPIMRGDRGAARLPPGPCISPMPARAMQVIAPCSGHQPYPAPARANIELHGCQPSTNTNYKSVPTLHVKENPRAMPAPTLVLLAGSTSSTSMSPLRLYQKKPHFTRNSPSSLPPHTSTISQSWLLGWLTLASLHPISPMLIVSQFPSSRSAQQS